MRLPTRKSEILEGTKKVSDAFLSPAAIQRYKNELQDLLKNQRQPAIKEVQRTAEMGDFSENAAYQMAKGRLRQINSRITILEEKLKSAVVIKANTDGRVALGSTVTFVMNGKETTYEILGVQEANPAHGKISHLSPLGKALLGKVVGEKFLFNNQTVEVVKVE
ncbi:MAG: GreA/GreB family elongation factor [Patescibacteria group bacterium]|jgi:transcription elongation GreA/GreB family factor